MQKIFKFGYYNIAFGVALWLILFLYKINIWLAVVGSYIYYLSIYKNYIKSFNIY